MMDERIRPSRRSTAGFTMVELVVVLTVATAVLAIVAGRFTDWRDRAYARQAAQTFARDLSAARSQAARGRESVVVRFYETGRWYTVTTASGREVARRRFGSTSETYLSAIDLSTTGDSLVFSSSGFATLSGTLGEALFTAGSTAYRVRFNSLGVSTVEES